MDSSKLTILQQAIATALEKLGDKKAPYPDSILAKEIRTTFNIQNKKSASIRIQDIEAAMTFLEESGKGCWSVRLDSVNNILIKKVDSTIYLSQEDKRNRQRTEKTLTLFTENDIVAAQRQPKHTKQKKQKWRYEDEE
ncbi:MAG: hypothetical protein K6E51_11495 [Treponema sp.]|nr:hypothetical protein [Treponema sp.]